MEVLRNNYNIILLQDRPGKVGQLKDIEKGTAVSAPHSRSRRKRRNSVKEVSLDMLLLRSDPKNVQVFK